MPLKSVAQRKYMHAKHPYCAKIYLWEEKKEVKTKIISLRLQEIVFFVGKNLAVIRAKWKDLIDQIKVDIVQLNAKELEQLNKEKDLGMNQDNGKMEGQVIDKEHFVSLVKNAMIVVMINLKNCYGFIIKTLNQEKTKMTTLLKILLFYVLGVTWKNTYAFQK